MTNGNTEMTKASTTEVAPEAKKSSFAFPDLRTEMDRLWEAIAQPWRPFERASFWRPSPAIEVFEKDGSVHIRAELAGMTDKDVEVSVTDDVLTIEGEKKEEHETKEANYYRSERSYGKFRRTIVLPDGADVDNAKAQFKAGVLEIDVPLKQAEAADKKKAIAVQSS
jgi:HSP20 family protein